jgi:hypothetical protein
MKTLNITDTFATEGKLTFAKMLGEFNISENVLFNNETNKIISTGWFEFYEDGWYMDTNIADGIPGKFKLFTKWEDILNYFSK